MLLKNWLFAIAAVLFFSLPAFGDEMVSLKGSYVVLNPDGVFAVEGNGISGTEVDLDDDLGFDKSKGWQGEIALNLGSFRLSGSYLPLRFSGDGILTETVIFNGQVFNVGLEVESEIDLDFYDVAIAWHVINLDDLPVRFQLGPELSVKIVNAEVSMEADSVDLKEDESALAAVPTIGLRSRIAISDYIGVVGRVGYLEYDDNSLLDVDAQIEFSPVPYVGIYAGYRYVDMDVDESGVFIDAQMDGFFGGVMIRF